MSNNLCAGCGHTSWVHEVTGCKFEPKKCNCMRYVTFKMGFYRHFKGKLYKVVAITYHSETVEALVRYQLATDYERDGVPVTEWVRPLSMWNDVVDHDGITTRRFTYEAPPIDRLFKLLREEHNTPDHQRWCKAHHCEMCALIDEHDSTQYEEYYDRGSDQR